MPSDNTRAALTKTLTIRNRRGLHARAAAKFVKTVEEFDATVEVSKDGQTVTGTSIMGLMMLAAAPGCTIDVATAGKEAEGAMAALETLVGAGFHEND